MAFEECPAANYQASAADLRSFPCHEFFEAAVFNNNSIQRVAPCLEAILGKNPFARFPAVPFTIILAAGRPDRGPLGEVQHLEMYPGGVRDLCHFPPQGIDFAYQMPLGGPADGRVAGHSPDGIDVHGQENRVATHPRRQPAMPRFRRARPQPPRHQLPSKPPLPYVSRGTSAICLRRTG